MRLTDNIRQRLAILQTALLCLILTSGSLFMHKHTTSDGNIVVHFHPYDLSTDASNPLHHESDREIHFLDVVFQGNYLVSDFTVFLSPTPVDISTQFTCAYQSTVLDRTEGHTYLRGPPLA